MSKKQTPNKGIIEGTHLADFTDEATGQRVYFITQEQQEPGTRTRSYTISREQGKEQKTEQDATPIPTPMEQKQWTDTPHHTMDFLTHQLRALRRLEKAIETNSADPWLAERQLDRLRNEWHERTGADLIQGLPLPFSTPAQKEKEQERTRRIETLQKAIEDRQNEDTWLQRKARSARARKAAKNHQGTPGTAKELIERRRTILLIDNNPQVAAQWQAMRDAGWITTPKGYQPWEKEEWTLKAKKNGTGTALLAFALGVIYAGDRIDGGIFREGNPTGQNGIFREAASLFGFPKETLTKARHKQLDRGRLTPTDKETMIHKKLLSVIPHTKA